MNKMSFVDELVKVGAMRCLLKRASDVNTIDVPEGMMSNAPTPDAIRLHPDQAATRLPATAHLMSSLDMPGMLGSVTQAVDPIDREKFNRAYKDRR
jgi:hypothetical protein